MLDVKFSDIELKAFKKMLANAPKYYQAVSANVLNDLAFEMREILQGQISGSMIVRNRGLLRKFTKVKKAKPGPISQQRAIVGTLRSKDFTGWAENEKGGQSERNRTIELMARGGDRGKTVQTANRMNRVIMKSSINGTTGNRIIGFMAQLSRRGYYGLFELPDATIKGTHWQAGVFKFKKPIKQGYRRTTFKSFHDYARNKPTKKSSWGTRYRVQQPGQAIKVRPNAIMGRSTSQLFSTGTMQQRWDKALHTAIERMIRNHGGEL